MYKASSGTRSEDTEVTLWLNISKIQSNIWGEPERAPYKREVCAVGLSVCLSVRTFIPSVVDCSGFGALVCTPTFNKHVVTNNLNKQVLILRSKFIDR